MRKCAVLLAVEFNIDSRGGLGEAPEKKTIREIAKVKTSHLQKSASTQTWRAHMKAYVPTLKVEEWR